MPTPKQDRPDDARPALDGTGDWQPIETAPRDGSWFWLLLHSGRVVYGRRHEGSWCEAKGVIMGDVPSHWAQRRPGAFRVEG